MSLTKGITLKQAAASALAMAAIVFHVAVAAAAGGNEPAPCTEDAMIVFDASGSMAGNMNQGIATTLPRINEVRKALGRVLPGVTRFRRVGLITYGPGPYQQCNVELNLRPLPDAGAPHHARREFAQSRRQDAAVGGRGASGGGSGLSHRARRRHRAHRWGGDLRRHALRARGKRLHAEGADLTVHVIGFQMKNFLWTGEQSLLDVRCLAEETGGLYITAVDQEELVQAFEKTLGGPMMSHWDKG